MKSTSSENDQSARREIYAISLITLAGAILRLWRVERLGLTHFDEGIYALSGLWTFRPHGLWDLDPSVIPYAPPGTPIQIGLSFFFFGASDFSAIVPSLVCGILTIPLVAWTGRRTFGPGAGAAAAALIAFSGPHVAFSRMALTDVPFLFFWFLAIAMGMRFLDKPRFDASIFFGLAVGITWNFKYNGILTGVIVASVATLDAFVSIILKREYPWRRTIAWGILAAIVAGLVYLPWYRFVDRTAGYANLIAHQRGYFKGPSALPSVWRIQMEQGVVLSGGIGRSFSWVGLAFGFAWLASSYSRNELLYWNRESRSRLARFIIRLLIAFAAFGLFPMLPWWLGVACFPALLVDRRPSVRVVAFWWMILSILTPLYHPYARLWLPLHGVGWLIVAGIAFSAPAHVVSVHRNIDFFKHSQRNPFDLVQASFAAIAILGVMFFSTSQCTLISHPHDSDQILAASDDLRRAVREIEKETPGRDFPIVCLASPVVRWYLLLDGFRSIGASSLDDLKNKTKSSTYGVVDTSVARLDPEGSQYFGNDRLNAESSPDSIESRDDPLASRGKLHAIFSRSYRVNLPTKLDWIGGLESDLKKNEMKSKYEAANRLLLYRPDP